MRSTKVYQAVAAVAANAPKVRRTNAAQKPRVPQGNSTSSRTIPKATSSKSQKASPANAANTHNTHKTTRRNGAHQYRDRGPQPNFVKDGIDYSKVASSNDLPAIDKHLRLRVSPKHIGLKSITAFRFRYSPHHIFQSYSSWRTVPSHEPINPFLNRIWEKSADQPLRWFVFAPKSEVSKACVRGWARNRTRVAIINALAAHGYDAKGWADGSDGRVLPQPALKVHNRAKDEISGRKWSRNDLIGTITIGITEDLLKISWEELTRQANDAVGQLIAIIKTRQAMAGWNPQQFVMDETTKIYHRTPVGLRFDQPNFGRELQVGQTGDIERSLRWSKLVLPGYEEDDIERLFGASQSQQKRR